MTTTTIQIQVRVKPETAAILDRLAEAACASTPGASATRSSVAAALLDRAAVEAVAVKDLRPGPAASWCPSRWHAYECALPVGHAGNHDTGHGTRWGDNADTRVTFEDPRKPAALTGPEGGVIKPASLDGPPAPAGLLAGAPPPPSDKRRLAAALGSTTFSAADKLAGVAKGTTRNCLRGAVPLATAGGGKLLAWVESCERVLTEPRARK